jgi:hypothetical protein|tara:strand:- start:28441 stop:29175 length:735 start_codon:yes stop_codon:yes gene_type:complete
MNRILLVLFVLTNLVLSAQESVVLRLNFDAGDSYTTTVQLDQKMGAQGGMTMTMAMNSLVSNADSEAIALESKINSIVMNMDQGGMTMNYDSTKSDEELDQMGQMMKSQFDPLLKATIFNSMDLYGNVLETRMEPSLAGMEQFTVNQNAINFPKEAISVGSSWVSETSQQGMNVTTKYAVNTITDGMVLLDISGTVSGVGEGSLKGTSSVDISNGLQTNATVEMTVSVQGMEMNLITTSTMVKN